MTMPFIWHVFRKVGDEHPMVEMQYHLGTKLNRTACAIPQFFVWEGQCVCLICCCTRMELNQSFGDVRK